MRVKTNFRGKLLEFRRRRVARILTEAECVPLVTSLVVTKSGSGPELFLA